MAIFGGKTRGLVQQINDARFESNEQKEALLKQFAESGAKAAEIMKLVVHKDSSIRNTAAKMLVRSDDANALPLLIASLKGKPPPIQRFLARVVGKFPAPEVLTAVQPLLDGKEASMRRAGIEIVCELPVAKTISFMRQLAQHPDPNIRVRVMQSLVGEPEIIQDQSNRSFVLKMAEDPDERVRTGVIDALKDLEGDDILNLFCERFRDDESYRIRQLCTEVLGARAAAGKAPNLLETMLPLLSEGDTAVRTGVIKILLGYPDHERVIREFIIYSKALAGWVRDRALESLKEYGELLVEPVIKLINDPDEEIRASALILGATIEDKRLVEPMLPLLKDDDWWNKLVAVEALGRIGDAKATGPLIECLNDDDTKWSAVEALTRIGSPESLKPVAKLLNDPAKEVRLEVIKAFEEFNDHRVLPLLEQCAQKDPALEVRQAASQAHKGIAFRNKQISEELAGLEAEVALGGGELPPLADLLREIRGLNGSDLHVKPGTPPLMRQFGNLAPMEGKEDLDAEKVGTMIQEILTERQREMFEKDLQLDFCVSVPEVGRYRANIYQDRLGPGGVFRVIPNTVPTFPELRIPGHLTSLAHMHQGLILVCGPASCGKSTTLAAFVNLFNETKRDHILTIEDPIEFVHPFKNCLVNQREVGKHTQSFAAALKGALREDPDVIIVGEMRDGETMKLATEASETGHLVVATVHTTQAHKAIDRLIESFPPGEQGQIRMMLSESLKAIICQQLIPRADGEGRIACFEVLLGGDQLANLIRDNKINQVPSLMQTSKSRGMRTVDMGLHELLKENFISAEQAYQRSQRKEDFEDGLPPGYLEAIQSGEMPTEKSSEGA